MKNIRFWRLIVNILFYIFYVLIISIVFSLAFPFILKFLWKEVLDPSNSIFNQIQYIIFFLVFVFTFIFRKAFYMPIVGIEEKKIEEKSEKQINKIKKEKSDFSFENDLIKQDESWLDIKIWREIK